MKSIIIKIGLVAGVVGIVVFSYKSDVITGLYDSTSAIGDKLAGGIMSIIENVSTDSSLTGKEYEIVYKWKDESGKYHYGSEPPQGKKDVIKIKILPEQNVVHLKKPESAPVANQQSADADSAEKSRLSGILESYNNPVKKAIDARNKMEQRNREIEEALQ